MADSAADTIRRAAQLLRERATAAPAGTWKHIPHPPTAGRGPTYHAVDCSPRPPYTASENVCDTGPYERGSAIAEHIAGMRPTAVQLVLGDCGDGYGSAPPVRGIETVPVAGACCDRR